MRSQLPHLGRVSSVFTSRFQTPAGRYIMGQLLPPRMSSQSGAQDPFRPFRASPKSNLVGGDVVIGADSRRYLLMDNGVSDRDTVEYLTFKVLQLKESGTLKRGSKTTDAVTKRTIDQLLAIATIWYAIEPLRPLEDTFRVPTKQYTFFTDYEVLAGDTLDDILITRVEKRLGVFQFQGHTSGS